MVSPPRPSRADGAVIAVKPGDVVAACRAVAQAGAGRVLSIAAGVPTATIEAGLGCGVPVVRAMPNTPPSSARAPPPSPAARTRPTTTSTGPRAFLGAVGDGRAGAGAAARRGHGPLGLRAGLRVPGGRGAHRRRRARGPARATSVAALAHQTLLGAARMLVETGAAPESLRADVTSPGGTTAAGLRVLEAAGVRAAFLDAVAAATERSRQLGGG